MKIKDLEFKGAKLDLEFLLKVLIIANFLIIFSVLFIHPIPEYSYAADTPTHIKWIELIKKDFRYIGYGYYGFYPKGFHLINAALSFLMPVGTAIALSTTVFGALLIFFSYKLALLLSQNKTQSLMTALLVSSINVAGTISSIPSTVPQTFALALTAMVAYYFLKKDWLKGGITLGLYSIIHLSFFFIIGITAIVALIELFRHNKTENLYVLIKMSIIMLAFLLPLIYLQNSYSAGGLNWGSLPKIQFYDEMISPLSLLSITAPFGIIILALIGLYACRKNIFEQKHQLIILWFFIPLILSQLYWLTDSGFVFWLVPGSRILIFMLFPLAFFSSKAISLLKRKELIFAAGIIILLFSLWNSSSIYNQKPSIDKYDLELIEHLKKDGKIDKAIVANLGTGAIEISLNRNSPVRDSWLVFAGYGSTLIDENRIDLILLSKEKYKKSYEAQEGITEDFENNKWILLKIGKEIKFQNSESLELYLVSFASFMNNTYEKYTSIPEPYFIALIAEDSGEAFCLKIIEGLNVESCPQEVDFTVKGEKKQIIELFNSYDKDYFKLKLLYMCRKKMLNFSSPLNPFLKLENAEYLSHIKRWTSTSPYSQPNENIARVFWALGLR